MVRGQQPRYGRALVGSWGAAATAKRLIDNTVSSISKRWKGPDNVERRAGEPVTTAADVRRDYVARRPRRRSRRVVRRAKRFTSRVLRVVDRLSSPIKVMFNAYATLISAVAGSQAILANGNMAIGTLWGGSAGVRDLSRIMTALGDSSTSQSQLRVKSGLLEVALKNASATNPCFVEVYTYKARKRLQVVPDLNTLYNLGFSNQPASLTGGTSVTATTYGSTPFLNRLFCENFKILKKETIKLAVGASTNLTLRTRMPKIMNLDSLENSGTSFDWFTKGFILICYGDPDTSTGAPVATALVANAIRTYVVESPRSLGLPNSLQTLTA